MDLKRKQANELQQAQQKSRDEFFMQTVAQHIARQDLADYETASQQAMDVSQLPQFAAARAQIAHRIQKAERKYQRKKALRRAGQIAACFAVVAVFAAGVSYMTVDAARNAINNFFLELRDGYAIIHGDADPTERKAPMPEGWAGAVTPEWVPARFTNVTGTEMHFNAELLYTTADNTEMLLISIWNAESAPHIDREGMTLHRTMTIDGETVSLLYKKSSDQMFLEWHKDDAVVQICGDLSEDEIIKIAENVKF